jgi:hypothetical protein
MLRSRVTIGLGPCRAARFSGRTALAARASIALLSAKIATLLPPDEHRTF